MAHALRTNRFVGLAVAACLAAGVAAAQDAPPTTPDLAQQLANPLANLISVPLQNNLDFGGGTGDAFRYTLNIQPVVPLALNADWNLITRTILPVLHTERVFPDHRTGLGDVSQSFFLSPSRATDGGLVWGVGPVLLYPTATDGLGQRQWGAGPTALALMQRGPWTFGMLANHIWSLGGTPDRLKPVDATFLQPFLVYNFPTGTSLFLNTESTYDWSRSQWTVPINAGVNQLLTIGRQPVQIGAGVRYFAESPRGGPDWGIRLNLVFVFPSRG